MPRTHFSWCAIRQHLLRSSHTEEFQRAFDAIRDRHTPIACYEYPGLLLDALHGNETSPGAKNFLLTALVEAAQFESDSECALTMVLLALWPGLDGILGRLKRRGLGTVNQLTSDILSGAIGTVRCLDRDRVHRMAATVLRNVERDVVRAFRKDTTYQHALSGSEPDDLAHDSTARSCEWVRSELDRLVGRDAGLVFDVAVAGYSQTEAAGRLGLSESATRKRYQRAARRLRQVLELA